MFKSRLCPLLVALLAATPAACQETSVSTELPTEEGAWQLVWSDEFDYEGLPDSAKWGYEVGGHGWGNDELQYYTERRLENARVEDGLLVIEARQEPFEGRDYTSARLVSRDKGEWTYGRFEARAKLPSGRGTWPAIWMLAAETTYGNAYWPDNGEIDIMEHV
ncbi:MAG: glycoside hydrolase family 16 protein, partial [Rhodothermales bacterium]